MKADTKMDQNKPTQAQKSSTDQLAAMPAGTDKSITGKPPSKVAYPMVKTGPCFSITGLTATV